MAQLTEVIPHHPIGRAHKVSPRFPWLSVFLLGVVHLSLAWSLDAAKWADGLSVTARAAVAGVFIGALLAQTSWPRWFVRLYALVVGGAITLYLGSTLIPPTVEGLDRAIEVIRRLVAWGIATLAGDPVGDNLVFVVDVTFLIWWSALSSTLGLAREQKVWQAVLPTGVVLVLNAYYAPFDLTFYVLIYLAAVLLLLVSTHLYEQVAVWEQERVRYPLDISLDFLRNGFLFALLILGIAWASPSLATSEQISRWLEPVKRPWHRVQEEWGRIFNTLNYQQSAVIPSFGRTFAFKGAPNLSDTPYFAIRATQGRYWRAAVYDRYESTGWKDTLARTEILEAYEGVSPPVMRQRETVTQTVTVLLPGAINLVAAPMPVRFNLPVEAEVVQYPRDAGGGGEILFAYTQRVLDAGETYTVVSLVPNPDAPSLRAAGTDYPEWIRQYYLQVPETLPERVRALAQDLTTPFDNPYDKAKALERYLRSIPYNEEIPFPPQNQDAVDWFLFDLQEGYCDYYASAMAVMARVVGIPARVASGYARGEFNEEESTWTVRESDAHTWPELWFPGYGWIPFEPTPSEPPLDRPDTPANQPNENALLEDFRNQPDREPNIPEDEEAIGPDQITGVGLPFFGAAGRVAQAIPWPWLAGGLLLVGGVLVGWRWSLRRLAERPDLPTLLYAKLVTWARRLGIPARPAYTPTEQGRLVAAHLPDQEEAVFAIVTAYEVVTYAPPAERAHVMAARERLVAMWETLGPRLWREWARCLLRHLAQRASTLRKPSRLAGEKR